MIPLKPPSSAALLRFDLCRGDAILKLEAMENHSCKLELAHILLKRICQKQETVPV